MPVFDGAIQPRPDRQRFGKASLRNCRISCTTLFARRLLMPMISLAAATAMAMMAAVVGSIEI